MVNYILNSGEWYLGLFYTKIRRYSTSPKYKTLRRKEEDAEKSRRSATYKSAMSISRTAFAH